MKTLKVLKRWGYFEILDQGENYQVKKLVLRPMRCTSMQFHFNRDETYYVLSGHGKIVDGDVNDIILFSGYIIRILKEEKHKLVNDGNIDLVIIEIQEGKICEDDIKRFD